MPTHDAQPSEWDVERAVKLIDCEIILGPCQYARSLPIVAQAFADARAQGRAEGIEAAAKLMDGEVEEWRGMFLDTGAETYRDRRNECEECAEGIRALADMGAKP